MCVYVCIELMRARAPVNLQIAHSAAQLISFVCFFFSKWVHFYSGLSVVYFLSFHEDVESMLFQWRRPNFRNIGHHFHIFFFASCVLHLYSVPMNHSSWIIRKRFWCRSVYSCCCHISTYREKLEPPHLLLVCLCDLKAAHRRLTIC